MFPLFEFGAFGAGGALAVALAVGVAFGWTLERAGLGHAPKLAGQFFLTDLTVFKVMFSAVLTAMLGLYWLGRLDWLDLSRVYVPETYVWPQLIGGLIFGIGFLAAGLCPGTSCVAAATGRIDGVATVGGMFGGVLVTGLLFAPLQQFYGSSAMGTLTLPQWTNISYGAVVGVVALIALIAFWTIEHFRIGVPGAPGPTVRRVTTVGALVLAIGAPLAGSPYRAEHARIDVAALATMIDTEADHVTPIELAEWLRDGRPGLHVIDVTGVADRVEYVIPSATRVGLDALTTGRWNLRDPLVVYSAGGAHAAQAWVLLRALGYEQVYFLQGGLEAWLTEVMLPVLPTDASDAEKDAFKSVEALSLYFDGEPTVGERPASATTRFSQPWSGRESDATDDMVKRLRRRGC